MSGPEERRRAVDLYSATPMTTARVVRHLGYPARQCLERWLAKDSRYAGHMAKPIIPLETRTKAIEPVPDGSERSATGSRRIARAVWPRCGPKTGTPARPSKPAMRRDRDAGDAEALRRRIEEPELGNAVMREVAEAFASSRGRYGYRRVKAMLRTGVSEKVLRGIMAEDGLTAHVPERRGYGSYGGETTPAPDNCV